MDDLADLFWMCVEIGAPEECWPWRGKTAKAGYGRCPKGLAGENGLAHRTAYAFTHGCVPEGLWVLHSCDNRPCCNPGHLFLGNALSNVEDMDGKGRRVNAPSPGSKNGFAKLTETSVVDIRRRISLGEKMPALAAEYGVTRQNIRYIRNRTAWKHVP